jgi:ankyrin repeat protein
MCTACSSTTTTTTTTKPPRSPLRTALHVAAAAGHLDVASRLVIAGCHVGTLDAAGHAAAHLAAVAGHEAVLAKILAAGYEVDLAGGPTALHNCGGSTALHLAAAGGHAGCVRLLLAAGASVSKEDFRGHSPLQVGLGGHELGSTW